MRRLRNPPPEAVGALLLLGGATALYFMSEPSASDKLAYVQRFGPIDLAISRREGWLPGILTAWSAMESEWGKKTPKDHATGRDSNNVFGIKAGPTWQKQGSPFVVTATHEYQGTAQAVAVQGAFRAYPDWTASAEDLVHLLKITNIFKPAAERLKAQDVGGFIRAIDASGYSTASGYGNRILSFARDVAAVRA